jgi:hypothetical protein
LTPIQRGVSIRAQLVLISLKYLLCQCTTWDELRRTAADLGCTGMQERNGALHLQTPDGERGLIRWRGEGFVWEGAGDAE